MLSKSIIKVGLVGIGNVLNAVLGFAFLAALAKNMDLELFGKYSLLISFLVVLSKLLDFGTNSSFVAESLTNKNPDNSLFKNAFLSLKLVLFLFSIPISYIFLYIFGLVNTEIFIVFILGLLAYGLNYTLFAILQKREMFLHIVALNLLPALVKGIFAISIFLGTFHPTLFQAFAIFSLSIFSSSFLLFSVINEFTTVKLSLAGISVLIKVASPAGISMLLQESWPALNNTITSISGGFTDVGIFSLASKISNIFVLVSLSIFTVLLPKNALRKKQNQGYDFYETKVMAVLILIMAGVATLVAKTFVSQIFGAKFEGSLALLGVLIFASAFTAIHAFLENYFFIEQKTKSILLISFSKISIFIVSGLIMVPTLALKGLAYANLISAVFAVLFSIFLVKKSN